MVNNFFKNDPNLRKTEIQSMRRGLFAIAGPIMLSNFLQTLYNLTDTWFLGKLGPDEVSSPSISFNIIFLLLLFSMGFGQAGRTLISRAKGAGEGEKINFYLGQILSMMIAGGLVLLPIIELTVPGIFRLMKVPDQIFVATTDYIRIILAGLPLMFLSFALQSAQEGIGKSYIPFYINLVTVSTNILLDWLLIFGIGPFAALGVRGAALATLIARIINAILSLAVVIFGRGELRLRLQHMKPDAKAYSLIAKIGLPASLGQSASALGFTVLQGIVNTYGTAVIAAFNVGNRIINLFMMPAMGFSQATAVMVGQTLGAGEKHRTYLAMRIALRNVLVFITISMTITFFFGNQVTRFFVDDPEVIRWGRILFRLVSPSVVFFALFMVFNGALQGSGDTRPIAFLNTLRLWGVRVPVAFLLCIVLGIGPAGIWIGMISSNIIAAAAAFILVIYRPWTEKLEAETI